MISHLFTSLVGFNVFVKGSHLSQGEFNSKRTLFSRKNRNSHFMSVKLQDLFNFFFSIENDNIVSHNQMVYGEEKLVFA